MAITAAVTVVSLGATAVSIEEQRRAQRAQKRQAKEQQRLAAIRNARARRKAAAAARRARATAIAEGAGRGVIGSSVVAGNVSAVQAQAAETLGFSRLQVQVGERIAGFAQDAANAQGRAAVAGAISGVPGQLGFVPSFGSGQTASTGEG